MSRIPYLLNTYHHDPSISHDQKVSVNLPEVTHLSDNILAVSFDTESLTKIESVTCFGQERESAEKIYFAKNVPSEKPNVLEVKVKSGEILTFEISNLLKLSNSNFNPKENDPIEIIIRHDKQVRAKAWHSVTVEINNNNDCTKHLLLFLNKYDQEIIWKKTSNSNYVSIPPNSNKSSEFQFMPLVPLDSINFKDFFFVTDFHDSNKNKIYPKSSILCAI